MNLSDLKLPGKRIERDGAFDRLGWVSGRIPGTLSFCEHRKYLDELNGNPCLTAVAVTPELARAVRPDLGLVVDAHPRFLFTLIHNQLARDGFYERNLGRRIAADTAVGPGARIADRNVIIGSGVSVGANAVINENTVIEDGVFIGAGAVIGSEGIFLARRGDEVLRTVHVGGVRLERGSFIGDNACVDKAVFSGVDTVVGRDTMVAQLSHISHNTRVGRRCMLCGGLVFGGSVEIGDEVFIGPGSSLFPFIKIGDGVTVGNGCVVKNDVPAGRTVAAEASKFIEDEAEQRRLMIFLKRKFNESR